MHLAEVCGAPRADREVQLEPGPLLERERALEVLRDELDELAAGQIAGELVAHRPAGRARGFTAHDRAYRGSDMTSDWSPSLNEG